MKLNSYLQFLNHAAPSEVLTALLEYLDIMLLDIEDPFAKGFPETLGNPPWYATEAMLEVMLAC